MAKTIGQKAAQKERSNGKKKRNIIKQIAKGTTPAHQELLRKQLDKL